jgi:PAS domain-containing protein
VIEADYVTKSGEAIPYEFTGTRLTDADGEPRGIIGIGRDIADRQRHLQRIEQQEQAFRQLHHPCCGPSHHSPFDQGVARAA